MKIQYSTIRFHSKSLLVIEQANKVIEEYAGQGYSLTLRQLYYQFIARDLFPDSYIDEKYNAKNGLAANTKNTQKNYDKLGVLISDARRAGLIDWDAIVDRTRYVRKSPSWETPQDIIDSCASQFRVNPWDEQDVYIELWFEKDALLGVFERAGEEYRLPFFSCRGYVSDSECWGAARRLVSKEREGKKCHVLHFGDHDPSGIDMSRDIEDRFTLFGASPEIHRLALNMDQVRKHNPPPNPAKQTDSRFESYVAKFGRQSWELDALDPDTLVKLVNNQVRKLIHKKSWDVSLELEERYRTDIKTVATHWDTALDAAKDADNE